MTHYHIALLLALAMLVGPLTSPAQPPTPVPRVGLIGAASATTAGHYFNALRQGLRDLGYVEGEAIAMEVRWAEGSTDRFPDLIAELIRLQVDVLVVGGAAGALAAKQAGLTTPVVFTAVTDPLGRASSVPRASWRQPHGGITGGRRGIQREMGRAVFKEAAPKIARVAVLRDPIPQSARSF